MNTNIRDLKEIVPSRLKSTPPLLVKAIVDGFMESLSGHIDGKSETFTLIPNPEPGPQEDESDDEEDSERKECPKVRYPADPSPNLRVELPKYLQEQVKRVHVNHAHPPKSDFIRMLKVARAKEQVIEWVRKEFSSEECEAQRKPSWRRKAAMPRTYHFNRVVAVDLFFVDGKDGQITILNILDHGTGTVAKTPRALGGHLKDPGCDTSVLPRYSCQMEVENSRRTPKEAVSCRISSQSH